MNSVQRGNQRFRRVIRAVWWITAGLTVGSTAGEALAQESKPSAWSASEGRTRAYARELRASLVKYAVHPADGNEILAPLIGAGLIKPIEEDCSDLALIKYRRSLADRSNLIINLRKLTRKLRGDYSITIEPGRSSPYFVGEQERFTPLVESWLNLRLRSDNFASDLFLYKSLQDRQIDKTLPHIWDSPIRVATTGNTQFDRIIAEALNEWRKKNPSLPIDKDSFPNSFEKSNLFIDYYGFRCSALLPCELINTDIFVRREEAASVSENSEPAFAPLIFFDQLHQGKWQATYQLYGLSAGSGDRQVTAWYRVDQNDHIASATCTGVIGAAYGAAAQYPQNASSTRDEILASVSQCLGAAMGAPVDGQVWTLGGKRNFRLHSQCPVPKIDEKIIQQVILQQLYSFRRVQ